MSRKPGLVRNFVVTFLLLGMGFDVAAATVSGKVVSIADGDTLTVLVGREQVKVRLSEIDAPESGQAFGNRSKQSLADLCLKQQATLDTQGTDRYGRTLARVKCNGVDANEEQIRRGMAWVYDKYVTDRSLYTDQNLARSSSRGLWADPNPTPPWEWRHASNAPSRNTTSNVAGASCNIKGNINGKGERIYHVPGQKYYAATQINESAGERWFCSEAEARNAGWRAAKN